MGQYNCTDPFKTVDGEPVEVGGVYWSHYLSTAENPVTVVEPQHSNFCQTNRTSRQRNTTKEVGGGIHLPLCGCQGFVNCTTADGGVVSLDGTRLIKTARVARGHGVENAVEPPHVYTAAEMEDIQATLEEALDSVAQGQDAVGWVDLPDRYEARLREAHESLEGALVLLRSCIDEMKAERGER
jgi:hypothetical protein